MLKLMDFLLIYEKPGSFNNTRQGGEENKSFQL